MARKQDNSVVTWGCKGVGGDSSCVQEQLAGGVVSIQSNGGAFAAWACGGGIVAWGDPEAQSKLDGVARQVVEGLNATASLKTDSSVVTWGSECFGGDSCSVRAQLAGGVQQIHSTKGAFAALKEDLTVQKSIQKDAKILPKRCKNPSKKMQKSIQKDPKINPKRCKNASKKMQKL